MASTANPNLSGKSLQTLLKKVPTGISIWVDRYGHEHLLRPGVVPQADGIRLLRTIGNMKGRTAAPDSTAMIRTSASRARPEARQGQA